MAKDVTCKVATCKYYSSGDYCDATTIEVSPEHKNCDCSSETNCKTFMAK